MDAKAFQDTAANIKCHIYCVKDICAPEVHSFPAADGTWKPKPVSLDGIPEGQDVEEDDGITSEIANEGSEVSLHSKTLTNLSCWHL